MTPGLVREMMHKMAPGVGAVMRPSLLFTRGKLGASSLLTGNQTIIIIMKNACSLFRMLVDFLIRHAGRFPILYAKGQVSIYLSWYSKLQTNKYFPIMLMPLNRNVYASLLSVA